MGIYIGPFQWRERISGKTGKVVMPGVFGWRMPTGATQAIDIRGPHGTETPDGFSPAKAIFITPDGVTLPSPYVLIATDPLEVMTNQRRRALATIFEKAPTASTRFIDLLHDLTTSHADMSRTVHCPPRIANRNGRIRHRIGGVVVKEVEVGIGTPEWTGLRERHRAVYRGLRLTDRATLLHSKYLATLATKYRLTEAQAVNEFIPSDLPKEEPVEPSTTLIESFPGTSETLGGDQTWTALSGTWGNASGKGRNTVSGPFNTHMARCEDVLSTDDMRVQAQIEETSAVNAYRGVAARFHASENTAYTTISRPEINDYYGQKLTSGTFTDIITSELSGSITLPSTDAIVVDGDEVEIFQGANSRGSTTDASISGHVRGGIGAYGESSTIDFDDWQAEDLGAEPPAGSSRSRFLPSLGVA